MSKFFINRPIVAMVISIIMVIIGAITILTLPVALFPNIVPPEVLERRRKGFLIRKRLVSMRANKNAFDRLLADSIVLHRFSIDKSRLRWALDQTLQGQDIRWWPAIDRLVLLELWLRSRGDF